jgi:hypothetical protein
MSSRRLTSFLPAVALVVLCLWPVAGSAGPRYDMFSKGSCVPGDTTLCLGSGRFRVETHWTTADGQTGSGRAVSLTSETGYFWFFRENDVETMIKILNGCSINQQFWVFSAGLTDVQVTTTVTDTVSGLTKVYMNPQGAPYEPVQDTHAFAACGASDVVSSSQGFINRMLPGSETAESPADDPEPSATGCAPSSTSLCLRGGRFRVETTWTTSDHTTGAGKAVGLTGNTGYFWFFDESNVELIVKVLDGCNSNDRFWVFAGGLTNARVTLTITDTQTGAVHTYENPEGTAFRPIQDTAAMPTCGSTCDGLALSQEQIESAAQESLGRSFSPWDVDFVSAVQRTAELLGCTISGSPASTEQRAREQAATCTAGYCPSVSYCGPGNSRDHPDLGSVAVSECLNRACFEHDACNTSTCASSLCAFSGLPQTDSCDASFFARGCTPGCAKSGTDKILCAVAEALTHTTSLRPAYCLAEPCSQAGQSCNSQTGKCSPSDSCPRVSLRLGHVDDRFFAYLNNSRYANKLILKSGYGEDTGFVDITPQLTQGKNSIRLFLKNDLLGWTYGYSLEMGGSLLAQDECGDTGYYGCNQNDYTLGLIFQDTLSFNYSCKPQ